ncbi:MAG: hypothetical protein AAF530_22110 [Pseudomonadota bacterium]
MVLSKSLNFGGQANMRYGLFVLLTLGILGSLEAIGVGTPVTSLESAYAQTLPTVWQNKAKKLAANINGSRQSLATDAAEIFSSQFKTDQFANRIENYRESLAKIPEAEDPNLDAAKEQLAQLEKEFAAAQTSSDSEGQAQAAAEPTTSEATSENVESSTALSPSAEQSASDVRPLVSGERVRVKKLTRDLNQTREGITVEGPSSFQDPDVVAQYKMSFDQYTAAIKRYPQEADPDVIEARTAYLALRDRLQDEFARAQSQLEQLGDVNARIAQIQNRNDEFPVPAPLVPPFGESDVKEWIFAGSKARSAAEFDYKQIQEIAPIAYLPEQKVSGVMADFSFRDLEGLAKAVEGRYAAIQQGYVQTNENIKTALQELENQVQAPTAYTTASEAARHQDALNEMILVAESAMHLEAGLGRPTTEVEGAVADLRDRRKNYDLEREGAIDAVRMPEAASTDPNMLAIANKIIENPSYGFGVHGPIVLNTSKITEHQRKESEIEIDEIDTFGGNLQLSGTQETTIYKWKEFQFATALKEDDSDLWRIYYIKPKIFSSGGSKTPLNEWISGGVVEGEFIREENVTK